MFDLLTRTLLWILIGLGLWYLFNKIIPKQYLTWLGGIVLLAAIALAFQDPDDRFISLVWTVLSFPLHPLGLSLLLMFMSWQGTKWKEFSKQPALIAFLVLLISSIPIVPFWISSQLEESIIEEVKTVERLVEDGDAEGVGSIIVLATRLTPGSPAPLQSMRYADLDDPFGLPLRQRLAYAATVYGEIRDAGGAPRFAVTGELDGDEIDRQLTRLLRSLGVDNDSITLDLDSATVRRSAVNTLEELGEQGNSIILIGPSLAIRRIGGTFARAFNQQNDGNQIELFAMPTDWVRFQPKEGGIPLRVTDLLPNVEGLVLTTYIIDEYLTSIYYFLRGWANPDFPLTYRN